MNIFQVITHAGFLEEITRHLHPCERISLARAAGIPRECITTPQPFFRFRGTTYLTPSYCSYKLTGRNHLTVRLPELFREDLEVTVSPVFKAVYTTARPDAVTFMDATDEMLCALMGSHPRADDWYEDNVDGIYPDYAFDNTIHLATPEQVILYRFFAAEKPGAPWERFYVNRLQNIHADFVMGSVPKSTRNNDAVILNNIPLFTCRNIVDYIAADTSRAKTIAARSIATAMLQHGNCKARVEFVHLLFDRNIRVPIPLHVYEPIAVFRAAVDTGYIFLSDRLILPRLSLSKLTYLFDALISRRETVRVDTLRSFGCWEPKTIVLLMSRMMQLVSPRDILSILPQNLGVITSFKQHLPAGTDQASLCSAWHHPISLGVPGSILAVGVSWKNRAVFAIGVRNLDYFRRLALLHQVSPQTILSTSAVYKQAIVSADVRFILVCEQAGFNLRDSDRVAALVQCRDKRIIDAFV